MVGVDQNNMQITSDGIPSPDGTSGTMFFISLEGEECVQSDPPTPFSSSLPKGRHLEECIQQSSPLGSLSSSPGSLKTRKTRLAVHSELPNAQAEALHRRLSSSQASAENKRSEMRERIAREREEKERKRKQAVAQQKRKTEKEKREFWARMKQRDFVVQYRRERLRMVPRSKLLQVEVGSSTLLNEMALLIQCTWLRGKIRPLVNEFLNTGIIDTDDYDNMKKLMMQKEVITIAANFVLRIIKCDPIAERLTNPTRAGKILLTAILLDQYGNEVMPNASGEEISLLDHASTLSEGLGTFLLDPTRAGMLAIAEQWGVFRDSFGIWQSQSRPMLVKNMQQDYISLQDIVSKLGAEARAEWMPHVKRHQERLRNALKRVAGQASIDELKTKLQGMEIETPKEEKVEFNEQPHLKEEETREFEESLSRCEKGLKESLSKFKNSETERIRIAHELMVDPTFSHRKLMEMSTGRPFVAEFEAPTVGDQDMSTFLQFAILVKSHLLDMINGKGTLAEQLQENLPDDFLQEQLRNGALEPLRLLEFLCTIMGGMCAPVRDSGVQQLLRKIKDSSENVGTLCHEMGSMLMLMHEDLSNFNLNTLKPKLAKMIVTYERNWYAAHILNQPFPVTEQLTRLVDSRISELHIDKKPLGKLHATIAEVFLAILGYGHDNLKNMAETQECELLWLDHDRLRRLRKSLSDFIILSALVLSLRSLGHPDPEGAVLQCRLLTLRTDPENIVVELSRNVKELESAIKSAVDRILSGNDPLVALLTRRIGAMLRNRMLQDGSTAKPVSSMVRSGFAEGLCPDYNAAAEELVRTYRLHREVLAPVYHKIITSNQS